MTLVIEIKGHRVQHVDNASHLAFLVTPGRGLSGRLDYACGWPSSDCWLGGGSVISVPPWPSLVGTKLDAMYWPRSAICWRRECRRLPTMCRQCYRRSAHSLAFCSPRRQCPRDQDNCREQARRPCLQSSAKIMEVERAGIARGEATFADDAPNSSQVRAAADGEIAATGTGRPSRLGIDLQAKIGTRTG